MQTAFFELLAAATGTWVIAADVDPRGNIGLLSGRHVQNIPCRVLALFFTVFF